MSEEQVEAIFQHACEGAAESIGSTRTDWQRVVDAIRFLRRSRDDARKDAVACAAAHINAVAQLSDARRLLDDARAQKPVGETCFDAQGIRWYNTSDRERLPFGTKLYAAPVPAQPAAVPESVAKDAARLDFLIAERAIVQNHIFTEGARFWVSWPVLGEDQRNLYKSPREAIDAAILSAADTEVKK